MENANITQLTDIERALLYYQARKKLKPLISFETLFSKAYGLENIIENDASLLVINHPAVGRDIALALKYFNKILSFTSQEALSDSKKLKKVIDNYMNNCSKLVQYIMSPVIKFLVDYLPNEFKKVGCFIPFNITGNNKQARSTNINSIGLIQKNLLNKKTVAFFQYSLDKVKSIYHSYLNKINDTVAFIAYRLYKKYGKDIPVTPVAVYGVEGILPSLIKRPKISIGKSRSIVPYINESKELCLEKFNNLIEQDIANLLIKMGVPNNLDYYNIKK